MLLACAFQKALTSGLPYITDDATIVILVLQSLKAVQQMQTHVCKRYTAGL